MKKSTIFYFLFLCSFIMQINAQTPPPINGVSCSPGTPSSHFYTEDFEYSSSADAKSIGGWTGDIKDHNQSPDYPKNGVWGITLDSELRSGGTGPNAAHSGNKYLMFDANGSTNRGKAVSPPIDLTYTTEAIELSFYMHAYGSDMGTLRVGVSTSNAGPFTNLFTQAGQYQTSGSSPWAPVGIDLTAYLGQTVYLEFDYTALPGSTNKGDMSIDFMRLQTCGEFCIPGNLGMSNLTDSSIDLNWTSGSTQTQWEYVLQDEGTGVPTGNGILMSSNTKNLTNLKDGYSYEVYHRSVCTDGFSEWAGPYAFTTELSYIKTIDCSAGDYTLNYCYKAVDWNETVQEFTYTSSDGSPLIMIINQGVVGQSSFSGDDELVVKDGEGTLLYKGIGNNGDLSGLSFRSNEKSPTSNVLHFYIDATYYGGCHEDGFTPINATVTCLSCQNIPEATYTKVLPDDCNTNPRYNLEVDVTSFGDATSLVLSDNLGLYSETVNELGTINLGPFNFGVDVQITVTDASSSSCFTKSKLFNVNNCPPPNDQFENATEITIGPTDYCENGKKGTLVEATPSPDNIPAISCSSTSGNDVWYKFVATQTVHRIIFRDFSSNEHLNHSFYKGDDATNLKELYCYENWYGYAANPIILTPLLTIGDTYYIRAYTQSHHKQEFEFTVCVQDPPAGALDVICNDAEPICLDETGTYKITNTTGLSNYLATGCLEWTANPTWMTFEVQESGPLNFTMSQIGGSSSNDMDIAIFGPFSSIDAVCSDYLTMKPIACKATNSNIEKLKIKNVNAGEKYLILSMNQSNAKHDLTVQQTNFGEEGAAVLRNRFKEPTFINPEPVCDDLGDGVETFDLTLYDTEILNGDTSFMVSYHLSRVDAESDLNAISTIEIPAGESQSIYAKLHTGPNSYCYTITQFPLTVLMNPEANTINPGIICDVLSDGFETIDLTIYSEEISGGVSDVTINYYLNEDQAILGSSPLYPLLKVYSGISPIVFARVENSNHCYSISSFTLKVEQPWAEFNTNEIDYSVCKDNLRTDPLYIKLINENFDVSDVSITWYRNDKKIEGYQTLSIPVNLPGVYTAKIEKNRVPCPFVISAMVSEKNCYGTAKVTEGISPNNDGINDFFDLSEAKVSILKMYNRNGSLVYSKNNYTVEWHGQSTNGNELPVGVYFYAITFDNGDEKSGWIYLNR